MLFPFAQALSACAALAGLALELVLQSPPLHCRYRSGPYTCILVLFYRQSFAVFHGWLKTCYVAKADLKITTFWP